MNVRATVLAAALLARASTASADWCTVSATPLLFGTYNVFASAPTDSTAAVTYECNNNSKAPISIELVTQRHGAATPSLVNGRDRLYYSLFQDAARTKVWGDGTSGSHAFIGTRSKDPVAVPVFGRIFPSQDVGVGIYTDVLQVVVNY